MKRGFYTIMTAQFFSSLADNALFVAAIELLRSRQAPEWQSAALVPLFAFFYVVLAPFVGAFADARPKGQVMFISNAIKIVGCLLMLFGTHPLLAYTVVGLGAAAYSPAKYGILTELLPPSQLVKANGWIEGLTIASIILGVLLGGQLVGPVLSGLLLSVDVPGVQTGIASAPEAAITVLVAVYVLAAIFNLRIPLTGVTPRPMPANPLALIPDFWTCNMRLWRDRLGQISLATTTLFWGVSGNLRYIVIAWAAAAFEYSAIPGTILCGWMSDKVFKSKRAPATMLFMGLSLLGLLLYWFNAKGPLWIDIAALITIGFLIYGPIMIIGLHALDLVPKKAAGTAAGFTGFFGYVFGSSIAGTGVGAIADKFGWNGVFSVMAVCCILTIFFSALTLKGKATAL